MVQRESLNYKRSDSVLYFNKNVIIWYALKNTFVGICFIKSYMNDHNIYIYIFYSFFFQLDGRMLAGQMKQVSGGVGRNIADALGRFGHDVCFLSAVGADSNGELILKSLNHIVNNTRTFGLSGYR